MTSIWSNSAITFVHNNQGEYLCDLKGFCSISWQCESLYDAWYKENNCKWRWDIPMKQSNLQNKLWFKHFGCDYICLFCSFACTRDRLRVCLITATKKVYNERILKGKIIIALEVFGYFSLKVNYRKILKHTIKHAMKKLRLWLTLALLQKLNRM